MWRVFFDPSLHGNTSAFGNNLCVTEQFPNYEYQLYFQNKVIDEKMQLGHWAGPLQLSYITYYEIFSCTTAFFSYCYFHYANSYIANYSTAIWYTALSSDCVFLPQPKMPLCQIFWFARSHLPANQHQFLDDKKIKISSKKLSTLEYQISVYIK